MINQSQSNAKNDHRKHVFSLSTMACTVVFTDIKKFMKKNSLTLKLLPYVEQTEEICKIIVSIDPGMIKDVKDQTEEVCWIALKKRPTAIYHIREPTEEMMWYVIRKNPAYIDAFKNPSDEMKWYVINAKPFNILHIKNPTEEMCFEALKADLSCLEFIKQTYEMQRFAVSIKPELIRECKPQPEDLCWLAIEADNNNIFHIRDPTIAMCMHAVKQNPLDWGKITLEKLKAYEKISSVYPAVHNLIPEDLRGTYDKFKHIIE